MLRTRRLLALPLALVPLTGAAYGLAPVAAASGDPVIVATDVPATVQIDAPATFDATVADGTAPVAAISWNFGDGSAAASGAQTSHAWGVAGAYTVTLTAGDALGELASQSFVVNVVAGAAPATAAAATAPSPPTLSFTAIQSRTRWAPSRGTVFTLTSSSRADVTLTFARRGSGAAAAGAHPLGTLSTDAAAGANRIDFAGRLGAHRRLRPGAYSVTMTASAAGIAASPVTLDFTIVRGKRALTP